MIKLGALGNLVLALGACAAIRRRHPGAWITLLTTAPYAGWLRGAPYFDDVWVDVRPGWWNVPGWLRLRRRLAGGGFARVYDLQTSSRSNWYFRLLPRHARPEWSGIAPGCSHPDGNSERDFLHDTERLEAQLRPAGIAAVPPPDLSWSGGEIGRFGLPHRFALLVPGSSAHRVAKRWPVEHYRELARVLADQGVSPVVLGASAEAALGRAFAKEGLAIDLTGRTEIGDLASLARTAALAVGNDTGPMHVIAACGCPSVVLFSADSDPALCAPRGRQVTVLRRPLLADLPVAEVVGAALRRTPAGAIGR